MVDIYESEQEQVEALKKWWSENAASVIAGVVIGVAGLTGWYGWQGYVHGKQEEASAIYTQMLKNIDEANFTALSSQAEQLVDGYKGTHYASLGQLAAARGDVEAKELEAAKTRLQWVVDNASTDNYEYIARLRLATLNLATGDAVAAKSLLKADFPESFDARVNELLGDVAVAEGDSTTARLAYDKALNAKNPPSNPQLIQMKRDDLGNIDLLDS